MKRGITVLVATGVLVAMAGPAFAAWAAGGSGSGSVRAAVLAAPTNLGAVAGAPSHSAINVTFTPGVNPVGTTYTVTRSKQKNGAAGAEVACVGLVAPPCVDTALTPQTTYAYTVKAVLSGWSALAAGTATVTTAAAPVSTALAITTPSHGTTGFGRNPSADTAGTAFVGSGYGTTVSAALKQGTTPVQTATASVNQSTGAWSYATSCLAKGTSYVLTVTQLTPAGPTTVTSSFTTGNANANCG